ncbi:MAG: hypothetical protein P8012_06095 [Desulfobacterales bacterium]
MYNDFVNDGEILTKETSFELMRHPTRSIKIQVKEILFPIPKNENEKFIARLVTWKEFKEYFGTGKTDTDALKDCLSKIKDVGDDIIFPFDPDERS